MPCAASVPVMSDPTREQVQRAVAALYPFVVAYGLPMNPEDLDEMALAVLRHASSDASAEEIGRSVQVQIQEHLVRSPYGHSPDAVTQQSTLRWAAMRQDDNGNVYQVGRRGRREAAVEQIAGLSAGQHKQLYWITDLDKPTD